MSLLLLHDTTRTQAKAWPQRYVAGGLAAGLILTPHASPPEGRSRRPAASERAEVVEEGGGFVLVDPASHAALTDVSDDYDRWGLWPGSTRGDFDAPSYERHTEAVFHMQGRLGAPFLIPVPALEQPGSIRANQVADVTDRAVEIAKGVLIEVHGGDVTRDDVEVWGTVAGHPTFWAAGSVLDHYITRLTEADIDGWYLVPVRSESALPVTPTASEVAGLCRTVFSLSTWRTPVIVGNANLLGLPALAAGATYIGTGYDTKQRVFEPRIHEPPDPDDEGRGGWLERVLAERLLTSLPGANVRLLYQEEPELAREVIGSPTQPNPGGENTEHHLRILRDLAAHVSSEDRGSDAAGVLLHMYGRSRSYAKRVEEASGFGEIIAQIEPYERGVEQWLRDEDWPVPL